MMNVEIYTDGACRGNPGPGGWGALLIFNDHETELMGSVSYTTNNRMELMAAIEGIRALNQKSQVKLYTDSQYVCQGMKSWLAGWKKKNWRNSKGEAVKNIDLWQMLDTLSVAHDIDWNWVRGHNGHPLNERVDKLANLAIDKMSEKDASNCS